MALPSLRLLPLAGLMVATSIASLAFIGSDAEAAASVIATVMGSTVLALWPLYAAPLILQRTATALAGLSEAVLAALAVALAVLVADTMQTALRMFWVLLPMLLIVQLLLALRVHRIVVTLLLSIAMLAPLWLGTLAALLGSTSGVAEWSVIASPLSALAASADCDYLRLMWFYQNTSIGASQFEYPTQAQTLSACGIVLTLLAAVTVLRNRVLAQNASRYNSPSSHPRPLQESPS